MTNEIIERQVGEKIKLNLGIDSSLTKDLGDGVIEAVVTTSAEDRHNEKIKTSGIDTSNYMRNPVVLYGHDYSGLPIGKALDLTESRSKIKARFQLAVDEYPFAKTVYNMIKGGYLNAISIGGVVHEWSQDYTTINKMEMVEFSVVPVPANPEALITGKSLQEITGKTASEIKEEYVEFVSKNMLDKVNKMGDDDINQAIKALENLLAALKESNQANSFAGTTETKRIKQIRLMDTAKAVNKESERVIRLIKLKKD